MTTLFTLAFALAGVTEGYLSGYHETPSTATLDYRRESGHALPQAYHVAVADCSLIGRNALLVTEYGMWEVGIFDCAGSPETVAWMEAAPYAAEISWDLWQAHPELIGAWAALVVLP